MAVIERVDETGSTNADLLARLHAGDRVAEGHWLIADRQTGGRGRLGRAWSDGAGNFMGSTVIHLAAGDPPAGTLALAIGLALAEAVGPLVPPPAHAMLKWPNDVMIGGAKLAGILLERTVDTVVVGIGVNLAGAPQVAGRETVALARFGPAPDRDAFAAALAATVSAETNRWRGYRLGPLIARWLAAAHPLGTALTVVPPGTTVPLSGHFAGLADDGALRLAMADGTAHSIHAGDVSFG